MRTDQVIDFYDLLSLANVAVWLFMAWINWRTMWHPGYWPKWLILSRTFLGIYWAVIYAIVFGVSFTPVQQNAFAGNFVRPAILLTGAIMCASVVITHRVEKNNRV